MITGNNTILEKNQSYSEQQNNICIRSVYSDFGQKMVVENSKIVNVMHIY